MNKLISKRVMTLVTAVLLLTAAFTSCTSTAKPKAVKGTPLVKDSAIVEGKLDNGMSYFVRSNKEPNNRIYLRLAVNTGSANEDDDQKGIAHFIEHMCFNGTKHFEKGRLTNYFESIGMKFGPEVNAYTNMEETVYMLEIPADNPEFLDNALTILNDWACAVSFDHEEIDKERGVVIEEIRSNSGLDGRRLRALLPFLYKGSKYEDRITLGDPEIIKNISYERITDYYNKWYRPELMSVVVVGDFNSEEMVAKVKDTMSSVPASKKEIARSEYPVPARTKKDILLFKDAEQPYTITYIASQAEDFAPTTTEEIVKNNLARNIGVNILNQRIAEANQKADSPWLDTGCFSLTYSHFTKQYVLAFVPKDGMFVEGFNTILDEYNRLCKFGVTQTEVNRMMSAFVSESEKMLQKKDTINSSSRADDIISYIVADSTVSIISEEDSLALDLKYLPLITINDVTEAMKQYLPDNGTMCIVMANENAQIPSEEEIMDMWKSYTSAEDIEAYVDDVDDDPLMEKPAAKAAILSQEHIDVLDANKYVLENGLTIYTRKSDYEQNKIVMDAVSFGGTNILDEKDIPNAIYSAMFACNSGAGKFSRTQFSKKIQSKQISLNISCNSTTDQIRGSSTINDFETLLQATCLYVNEPAFSDDSWANVMAQAQAVAEAHGTQPEDAFFDKIREVLYKNDLRHTAIVPEILPLLNKEGAERIYRERFTNAADWSFIFTGDFNEEELVDLCCYYLGTIPGDASKKEEAVYPDYYFPSGCPVETVNKGLSNKGTVFIAFGGELPEAKDVDETYYDMTMLNQLRNYLDMKLHYTIREDKSGTYGVSVSNSLDGNNPRFYEFQIYFECDPEREDELHTEVLKVINDLKSKPAEMETIAKVQEQFRRDFEVNQRNNYWWNEKIKSTQILTYEPMFTVKECDTVCSWITPENIQATAKRFLNTDNFATIYLVPEK